MYVYNVCIYICTRMNTHTNEIYNRQTENRVINKIYKITLLAAGDKTI
jgi:hypothetical protein